MSESDDSDILADIQALDEALALDVKKKPQQHSASTSQHSDTLSDDDDPEDNDDCFDYLCANRQIDESLNAYEINTRLLTGLTIAKKKLTALLQECEQKIKLLDKKMEAKDASSSSTKYMLYNAGMPYFKDKDYFSAPKNDDTKLKEARGELFVLFMRNPSRWSKKDRETLLNAINNQAVESVLSGNFNIEIVASTSSNKTEKTKLVLPRNFNEMVGAIGEKQFDWYKISAMDFDNKHSPGECQAMWNVYLHPDIRKSEWTVSEDSKLLKCAKEFKIQDWDAIAWKLGTNRSAYQCFIRYNTIKKIPCSGRAWTKQEDKHLMKVMNAIRIGDYIPWTEVSNHMRHRTKQQIYVRWTYSKAPHLRKGRFTNAETTTLLKAVHKYGKNFCKISSTVMPQRTSVQLQLRYDTVIANINTKNLNLWTTYDDHMLLNLYQRYKNKWSKIATHFTGKSRTQVRHRFRSLERYITKGVNIENIPRPPLTIHNRKLINMKSCSSRKCDISIITNKPMQLSASVFEIQLRLYETLCFPPSVKANNSEEEPYDIKQLALDTKKLYNMLNLLNARLDIPNGILNHVQLNSREKQLLVSLKERVRMENNGMQKSELIEQFRTRMFGNAAAVSNSDFFIPPLPFNGWVRIKKTKIRNTSTDYNLDVNETFCFNMPDYFSVSPGICDFISFDENIQFEKISQLLTKDCHSYEPQRIDLYKSRSSILLLRKDEEIILNDTPFEYNEPNRNLEDNEQTELHRSTETVSINEAKETDMNSVIQPNRATLLGLKNLLLWKLLYECQDETRQHSETIAWCRGFGNNRGTAQIVTNSQLSTKTESAEYQLLRTRLLQLFKLPICLSNTIMQMHGPEAIFLLKEKLTKGKINLKKRKCEVTNSARQNKRISSEASTNSDPPHLDIPAENRPYVVRSCRTNRKKYKVK